MKAYGSNVCDIGFQLKKRCFGKVTAIWLVHIKNVSIKPKVPTSISIN